MWAHLLLTALLSLIGAQAGVVARQEANEHPGKLSDVARCLNDNQENVYATSWKRSMASPAAPLRVLQYWQSPRVATVPITMTIQMSAGRIWQLKSLCNTYPGPVAVVLYSAILDKYSNATRVAEKEAEAVATAGAFYDKALSSGRCKLDLMVVREVYESREAMLWYPVNQLRNYARLMARTPLIGLVDGDLLVTPALVADLLNAFKRASYLDALRNHRQVYILPAFITTGGGSMVTAKARADAAVNATKAQLHHLFNQGTVKPFDPGASGHSATNYRKWFATSAVYEVRYRYRYEPWIVCDRQSVPWHDVTFRGYGLNKIIHLESLNQSNFRFVVHPSWFVIHRAHPATAARAKFLTGKSVSKRLGLQSSRVAAEAAARTAAAAAAAALPQATSSSSSSAAATTAPLTLLPAVHKRQRRSVVGGGSAAGSGSSLSNLMYDHIQAFGRHVREEMAHGRYVARVDAAVRSCLQELDWWRDGASNGVGGPGGGAAAGGGGTSQRAADGRRRRARPGGTSAVAKGGVVGDSLVAGRPANATVEGQHWWEAGPAGSTT